MSTVLTSPPMNELDPGLGEGGRVFAIGANAIVAAPMISSYCIMSLVWSRIFLKEKLSKAQYAVIAVAAVGIAILGME